MQKRNIGSALFLYQNRKYHFRFFKPKNRRYDLLKKHSVFRYTFVAATEATGATFALDGIRAEWKIYCIRSAYYIYKNYGSDIYQEALKIIVEAWWGDSDSFLSGILHGVTRFVAMYRDEYSRERLIARLSTVHPKTITKNARKDTGNTADRHMKQILEIYNGSSRSLSLPVKR